jgi:hypothetical protein
MQSIPQRIIVWAERSNSTKTFSTTDTFARLQSVSILWDNNAGLNSQCSEQQLWMQSVKNGAKLSWLEWTQTVGSVYILDMGVNLAITKEDEAPSLAENKQFQIRCNFLNINQTQSIAFTLWVAVISNGIVTIREGTAIQQTSVLTKTDILTAKESPMTLVLQQPTSFYGGGLNSLKKFASGARKVVTATNNFVKKHKLISNGLHATGNYTKNPALHMIATGADALGYGNMHGAGIMNRDQLQRTAYEIDDVNNYDNDNGNDNYFNDLDFGDDDMY